MFKLLRYFTTTSLLAFAVVATLLGVFYRQRAVRDLVQFGENKNVALTRAFANSLWPEFAPFVASASELGSDNLAARPEIAEFHQAVLEQMDNLSVIKVKVYDLQGLTVFSTQASQIGEDKSTNIGFLAARAGEVASELTHRDSFSAFEEEIEDRDVISSYIPIQPEGPAGPVEGVFEVYDDVTPLLQQIRRAQMSVTAGVTGVLAALYGLLFVIVRRADGIIQRQYHERIRAERALQQAHDELEQRIQKRTTELHASETRYRSLFENAAEGIFQMTSDGCRFTLANPALVSILGFESAAELVETVADIGQQLYVDPERRAQRMELLRERGALYGIESQVWRKDGSVRVVSENMRAVRAADGRLLSVEGTIEDITARKQAEAALRESEERFRGLLESAPDAIVTVDTRGHIALVNAQTEKLFGYQKDELIGQPVEVLLPGRFHQIHVGHRDKYLADPHTRPMGSELDLAGRRKDGSEFPVEVSLSPLETTGGLFITSIIHDITSRKSVQDERERLLVTEREQRLLAESLGTVGLALNATLDLPDLLDLVCQESVRLFEVSAAFVWLVQGDELVGFAGYGHGREKFIGTRLPLSDPITLGPRVVREKRPLFVNDAVNSNAVNQELIRLFHVSAILGVPLVKEDKALGALLIIDAHRAQRFGLDDVETAMVLGSQAAVAIQNARLFRELDTSYDHTLNALVAALDARDKETEGHSQRVAKNTITLARRLNLPEDQLATIRRGALLHDIGKIGVPDAILHKRGPLTDEQWAIMRRHPALGERILMNIRFLEDATQIISAHHERWDGAGYPIKLKGKAIPLGARIFAVVDTLDAITSDRPYRAAQPFAVARAEIESGSGTQFDPRVVQEFLQVPEENWVLMRAESQPPRGTSPLLAELPAPTPLPPELEALNRMISAVSGSLELNDVLLEAARAAVEILGAAASGLFLYDPVTDRLSLAADRNLPPALKTRFTHFPVLDFHNESVIREGRMRILDDSAEIASFVELGIPTMHPDWGQYLCVPLTNAGTVNGVMGLFGRRPHIFDEHDLMLFQALGEHVGRAIAHARLHESMRQMAHTDALTGARNRRYLDTFLEKELIRWARYHHGGALIMLDLDGFKEYNDSHGHPAGDEALRQVVRLLHENVRAVDMVTRYGGDEFVVVLPETDREGALAVAEKLHAAIEAHAFPHGRLTASLGLAGWSDDAAATASPETFISQADQALLRAKQYGGDRISF